MITSKLLEIAIILCCLNSMASAKSVIIVNHSNSIMTMDLPTLKKIYRGKNKKFIGGGVAIPVDLAEGSIIRNEFYLTHLKKSADKMKAYWIKAIFSGSARQPEVFDNSAKVKDFVRSNKLAIGYIDSSDIDDTVKVIEIK